MKTEEEKRLLIENGISPTSLSMMERFPAYSTNTPPESYYKLKEYVFHKDKKDATKKYE